MQRLGSRLAAPKDSKAEACLRKGPRPLTRPLWPASRDMKDVVPSQGIAHGSLSRRRTSGRNLTVAQVSTHP